MKEGSFLYHIPQQDSLHHAGILQTLEWILIWAGCFIRKGSLNLQRYNMDLQA